MSRVEHLERHVDDLRLILAMKQDEIERLRHALHMIATHPEIHLGAAEEMAAIAEHALQQKDSE